MEKKSPHILNASSGLLGFCLVILTSLEITKIRDKSFLDEVAGVASFFLAACCIFSFMSIRCQVAKRERQYEKVADLLFMSALLCIIFTVGLVIFNIF